MAYLNFRNIKISGIAACVPREVESNLISPLFSSDEERQKYISEIGVCEKRRAADGVTTADLCEQAARELLRIGGGDINALIFATQSPDYILPATAPILQDKLGLSKECLTFDISIGCSGWVYGIAAASALVSNGSIKRALLLCGDTTTRTQSPRDKTSYPLFGDAGTATLLEYEEGAKGLCFHLASDGSGKDAIIIPSGGYRNPITAEGLEYKDYGNGKVMTDLHARLEGMDVFSFAIVEASKSIKGLCKHFSIEMKDIDCFTLHQANLMLNETIRRLLKVEKEKVPCSLERFGNSSSATIPVTLVTERREQLTTQPMKHIACGFGVGLSWGSVYFETDKNIIVPELIEF